MTHENIFKTNSDVILGFGVELEMGIEPNVDGLKVLNSTYEFDENELFHRDGAKVSMHTGPRDWNRTGIYELLVDYLDQYKLPAVVGNPEFRDYGVWQLDNDETVEEAGKTCSVLSYFKIIAALIELP